MKTTLTISEFASLVGTTKDTLIHYDDIELFMPAYRQDNGYRIYRPEQANTFLSIQAYRNLGYGLQDIKDIFKSVDDYQAHQTILKERIQKEKRRLSSIEGMLVCRDDFKQYASTISHDTLYEEMWDLSDFYIHPQHVDDDSFLSVLSEIQTLDQDYTMELSWMIGIQVNLLDNSSKIFIPRHFPTTHKQGKVLVYLTQGDFDNLQTMITHFYEKTQKRGYTISNTIYALQISDEISEGPLFNSQFLLMIPLTEGVYV